MLLLDQQTIMNFVVPWVSLVTTIEGGRERRRRILGNPDNLGSHGNLGNILGMLGNHYLRERPGPALRYT